MAKPSATDVQVFVSGCEATNGTDSKCVLYKGTSAIMTIKFSKLIFESQITINFKNNFIESSEAIPSLERIIAARVPAAFDKKVEMPYGPAISPCTNSSMVASDGTECFEDGVDANKSYTYVSSFDVLKSFPSVMNQYPLNLSFIHLDHNPLIFPISAILYIIGTRHRNPNHTSTKIG